MRSARTTRILICGHTHTIHIRGIFLIDRHAVHSLFKPVMTSIITIILVQRCGHMRRALPLPCWSPRQASNPVKSSLDEGCGGRTLLDFSHAYDARYHASSPSLSRLPQSDRKAWRGAGSHKTRAPGSHSCRLHPAAKSTLARMLFIKLVIIKPKVYAHQPCAGSVDDESEVVSPDLAAAFRARSRRPTYTPITVDTSEAPNTIRITHRGW